MAHYSQLSKEERMSAPILAPSKRLSGEEIMDRIDKIKPDVFAAVAAGKVDAGTVTATCFNLINAKSQRLATLTTDQNEAPGLAFFHPGSDRARLEVMLEADGPTIRLNDVKGRNRLRLHVGPGDTPSVAFMGPQGRLRIVFMVDGDRPHLSVCPRGARKRSVIVGVPFNKLAEPAAWSRVLRAGKGNRRAAFESAARDAGFVTPELPKLWNFVRRKLRTARRRAA
jgi:hypothetical protein